AGGRAPRRAAQKSAVGFRGKTHEPVNASVDPLDVATPYEPKKVGVGNLCRANVGGRKVAALVDAGRKDAVEEVRQFSHSVSTMLCAKENILVNGSPKGI